VKRVSRTSSDLWPPSFIVISPYCLKYLTSATIGVLWRFDAFVRPSTLARCSYNSKHLRRIFCLAHPSFGNNCLPCCYPGFSKTLIPTSFGKPNAPVSLCGMTNPTILSQEQTLLQLIMNLENQLELHTRRYSPVEIEANPVVQLGWIVSFII